MRYRFVRTHELRWEVGRICRLLNVSRSGYYAWRKRTPSNRVVRNEALLHEIHQIYAEGKGEYGSPTIYRVLREQGLMVNRKRVVRLMRMVGLRSKVMRQYKRTTVRCKDRDAAPNLLQQNFTTHGPNRVWLSDITYIPTGEGWLYLTTVEDMWSRRIIGHAMKDTLQATGVIDALQMALGHRAITPGLIFHSDRGTQYADQRVRAILTRHEIEQSMSSTGNCYDNAMAESFFATLKKGHVYWERFKTGEEARRKLFEYLEIYYNRVRRHSSLGYKTPVAFEQRHGLLA